MSSGRPEGTPPGASAASIPGRPPGDPSYGEELTATAKVIAVSTFFVGVLIGVLFRVGMLILRLDRPETSGVVSDDGFVIGRFTLAGTYNLFTLGGALAAMGVAAYIAVQPHLVGPRWFRVGTVGLTAMLLGGATAIHGDGVDFTALDPELGVVVFLAIPLIAGLATPLVVDAVARRQPRIPPWLAVLLPLSLGPGTWLVTAIVLGIVAALLPVRRSFLDWFRSAPWRHWVVRAAFLAIPILAASATITDITEVLA